MLAREFFISVYKVNSFSMSSTPYLRNISDKPCKYESFLHSMQFLFISYVFVRSNATLATVYCVGL